MIFIIIFNIFTSMKMLIYLLVIQFTLFLSAPTLVMYLGVDSDLSSIYEASEEEETHNNTNSSKDIKNHFKIEPHFFYCTDVKFHLNNKFYCANVFHDSICKEVIIPPPDFC